MSLSARPADSPPGVADPHAGACRAFAGEERGRSVELVPDQPGGVATGPLLLGSVLAAYGISRTLLLAVGGQASDRRRPWTVMTGADAVRAVAAGALAVAALTGPPNAYILMPISAVIGAGEALFLPGSYAIVPALLPDAELEAGNAITTGGTQFATLIGPGIGGSGVALAGATPAFATDAASFAISTLTFRAMRLRGVAGRQTDAQLTAVQENDGTDQPAAAGSRSDAAPPSRHRTGAPGHHRRPDSSQPGRRRHERGGAASPRMHADPSGAGAGSYGALLAAYGAGALLGTLAAGQARRARRPAVTASAGFLAEAACLALVPYLGGTIPAAALLAFGALNGFGTIMVITAFQRRAPPAVLGQLMAVLLPAATGVFPVSVFIAGLLVDHLGPAPFFPLAGALLAVAIAVSLTQRNWRDLGSAVNARPDQGKPVYAAVTAPGQPPASKQDFRQPPLCATPGMGLPRQSGTGYSPQPDRHWTDTCVRPRLRRASITSPGGDWDATQR